MTCLLRFTIVFIIVANTVDAFLQIPRSKFNVLNFNGPLQANPRRIDIGEGRQSGSDLVKHDLLTAADEFALSKQYKLGLNILCQEQTMSNELGRAVTTQELSCVLEIPPEQVKILIHKGSLAKKKLVRANMRLVFHIAGYYRFRGVAYPDLVQEGTFGLIKAVEKYDPDKGFRFSTYASWWIKQAVSRAVAEKSRIVRLPVHIHDLMVSMSRVEKQFQSSNGRRPTTAELAERLALPLQKVELLVKSRREVNSIDDNIFKDGGKSGNSEVQMKDRLESDVIEPSRMNEKISLRQELRRSMQHLSEREAQIVEMRFGLVDGNSMTLEEIGKHFSVTRERVRQIEARALSKLRQPNQTSELKEIFQDHSLLIDQLSLDVPNVLEPAKGPVMENIKLLVSS